MIEEMILDTDLGADCDDAIAIGLMCSSIKKGLIYSDALTISSSRKFAPSSARALLAEYGFNNFEIGKLEKHLKCDEFDYYNKELHDLYSFDNSSLSADFILTNKLLASKNKISLVAIGPLTNVAQLMINNPTIFEEKIKDLYIMGGNEDYASPEWNFSQDIKATKYVFENCNKNIYLCTGELGNQIKTGQSLVNKKESATKKAIELFKMNSECPDKSLSRESWDPLTVLCLIDKSFFKIEKGFACQIADNGASLFKKTKEGNVHIVRFKNETKKKEAQEYINNSLI